MNTSSDLDRLLDLLAIRSTRRGKFVLSSGRESSLYVDARLTTMSPDGMLLIGKLGSAAIVEHFGTIDSVGGLTLGADPIAYAIAHHSATTSHPLRAFTVRKEAKGYGAGRLIEGPFEPADRVVVIEDVITSGSSALRAANAVRDAGATVAGILALVDREEGGRELLEDEGFAVRSIATATQILARGLTPEDQTSSS